jgi:hypothetical protein
MWGEIASRIGLKIISLGKEVMAQNRAIEMALSPTGEGGKATVSLCGDARWGKRSSGRNYSSISGWALALGCRSQLVWDAEPMSNLCIKCMKGIPHNEEVYAPKTSTVPPRQWRRSVFVKLSSDSSITLVIAWCSSTSPTTTRAPKRFCAPLVKRCIAYAVRQNCLLDAAKMKNAILTTVEHHFGNHVG